MDSAIWSVFGSGLSGLAGAFLGAYTVARREKQKTKHEETKDAQYLALVILPMLDQIIETCVQISYDDGKVEGQYPGGNGTAVAQIAERTFVPLNAGVEWKSLSPSLMHSILNLPARIDATESTLDTRDYFDPPNHSAYYNDRQWAYIELGAEVGKMAELLRAETRVTEAPWYAQCVAKRLATRRSNLRLGKIEREAKRERSERQSARDLALF